MLQKSSSGTQSYFWESNSVLKEKRLNPGIQSYMPFLFRSKRQFHLNSKDQSPPIGSYEISSAFKKDSVQQYQHTILKDKFEKQKQMGIFKSKKQRFQDVKSQIPGPAAYTQDIGRLKKTINPISIKKQHSSRVFIKKAPNCPAIPQNHVKYGYVKDKEGNFKFIQKTEQQLEQQKHKLKQYCSGLIGESNYNKKNMFRHDVKTKNQKKELRQNLQKYVSKDKRSSSQKQNNHQRNSKIIKPKTTFKYPSNLSKTAHENDLGPGYYNQNLNTFKKEKKKEQFQFFGSSQLRFPRQQYNANLNQYDNKLKQKKHLVLNTKPPGKIHKKSPLSGSYENRNSEKDQLPGPGYYDPQLAPLKKCAGNTKFGYEQRFKQDNDFPGQDFQSNQQQQNSTKIRTEWGYLRKDKIKSPHLQYEPVDEKKIFGIMNHIPSDEQEFNKKKTFIKPLKNKQNAVFISKNQRIELTFNTYYQQHSQRQVKDTPSNKKGCFISKLPKKLFNQNEKTPGPGAYDEQKISKKTFNIKNY